MEQECITCGGRALADANFAQVFPASGYDQLYKAMASAYKAGKSTTYRAKYQVLDNAYKAVRGGWEVRAGRCRSGQGPPGACRGAEGRGGAR